MNTVMDEQPKMKPAHVQIIHITATRYDELGVIIHGLGTDGSLYVLDDQEKPHVWRLIL